MAEPRSTMIDPPIEDLLDKVDSKFTLVTLSAKRARQINSYFNQLGEGLGAIVPPQVASVSRKPLSIALEEIAAGKVRGVREPESEEDAVEGDGDDAGGPVIDAGGGDADPVA
jgi:DNA-directed RNA polymerase subunit omega